MADFPVIVEASLRARFVCLEVQPGRVKVCLMRGCGVTGEKIKKLKAIGRFCSLLAWLSCGLPAHAADYHIKTAVAARASEDYVRTKLSDGSFATETYAFGEGGCWGGDMRDKSIDDQDFTKVAKVVAVPLRRQNYRPASDARSTKLLIMVYWGTTSLAALPEFKARTDFQNAKILGYDSWWADTAKYIGTPFVLRNDMLDELEDRRYFVVLMAYDFQLLLREKKHKLLWETRFSISEQDQLFAGVLPAMAQQASQYFGRDSGGLVRKRLPGRVNLGELKFIGAEPEKK